MSSGTVSSPRKAASLTVKIRIVEEDARGGHEVEVRSVTTDSQKRLTAHVASKILRREFPNVPHLTALKSKTLDKRVFVATHSVKPTDKCNFHYIWRRYYLTQISN